jgi:hypothetical protein
VAQVKGSGITDMRELAVKLRAADPALKRDLQRQFRAQARPVVAAVKRSILEMPAEHGGSKPGTVPLRAAVARTVGSSARVRKDGIEIAITSRGSRMPAGEESMPKHLDSPRGFAHPVYARGARFSLRPSRARKYRSYPASARPLVHQGRWTWVRQVGKPHWFEDPVTGARDQWRRAALAAMEETSRRLG